MNGMTGLQILATGRSVPSLCVSNEALSQQVETSDAWIYTRTGIRQRYFCTPEETNTLLATRAARAALQKAGLRPDEIGLCVCGTFSPDHASPSLACEVHERLGLPETTPAFDVNAACTGFLTALETARCFLAAARLASPYALVIGSECISRVMDHTDRSTCVLFGDGAGAAVARLSEKHPYQAVLHARGDVELLKVGGAGRPDQVVQMQGSAVFRFAAEVVPACIEEILTQSGYTMADIDYVVCHQANGRIIDHVVKKLGAPPEKFYKNMQRYANTSAASIPLALDEMAEAGLLHPGQRLICVGFGAGLTWGGALLTL